MKKITALILSAVIGLSLISAPVFAGECVMTSVLGGAACNKDGDKIHDIDKDHPLRDGEYNCSCDDGEGGSITHILYLVVDIMTIGIGILGVIGISIVGVQYLTAGGNEEKTRKAKRRMFEIILGLVAYAVIYALLKFLGVQPN